MAKEVTPPAGNESEDLTKAELEQLRKDKADRDAADKKKADDERAAEKAELDALRKLKADLDKAKEKTPDKKPEASAPAETKTAEPKAEYVSRWFSGRRTKA